ncbi:MAG: hypothetical protein COZ21_10830 [Bacteroidetes bacterium CG_4_10_14_3_um_filter_31_20]|nr:MAG: hypothetical protein COZ59_10160 [Bacteroidetes bacterium CG_4_8_14_3_um_filter_31_14]PIY03079.1 MAG: hypothetical protein COZ21_10830 [Bacteroidetes bacterium CG_4_10_14_3_um_filter_31_20]
MARVSGILFFLSIGENILKFFIGSALKALLKTLVFVLMVRFLNVLANWAESLIYPPNIRQIFHISAIYTIFLKCL